MVDLPDPPRRELTKRERKAINGSEKTLRMLLPAMRKLNQLTDIINEQVDVRATDREMTTKIAMLMWQGEFIEKILSHSSPVFATMDIVKFMEKMQGEIVQVKQMTLEEAQQAGYL
jgi:hypothetical protein